MRTDAWIAPPGNLEWLDPGRLLFAEHGLGCVVLLSEQTQGCLGLLVFRQRPPGHLRLCLLFFAAISSRRRVCQ
jgi:hypothetical protein